MLVAPSPSWLVRNGRLRRGGRDADARLNLCTYEAAILAAGRSH